MPGNPKDCRNYAKACLKLELPQGAEKEHFEALAQRWLALATDLEVTQVVDPK